MTTGRINQIAIVCGSCAAPTPEAFTPRRRAHHCHAQRPVRFHLQLRSCFLHSQARHTRAHPQEVSARPPPRRRGVCLVLSRRRPSVLRLPCQRSLSVRPVAEVLALAAVSYIVLVMPRDALPDTGTVDVRLLRCARPRRRSGPSPRTPSPSPSCLRAHCFAPARTTSKRLAGMRGTYVLVQHFPRVRKPSLPSTRAALHPSSVSWGKQERPHAPCEVSRSRL